MKSKAVILGFPCFHTHPILTSLVPELEENRTICFRSIHSGSKNSHGPSSKLYAKRPVSFRATAIYSPIISFIVPHNSVLYCGPSICWAVWFSQTSSGSLTFIWTPLKFSHRQHVHYMFRRLDGMSCLAVGCLHVQQHGSAQHQESDLPNKCVRTRLFGGMVPSHRRLHGSAPTFVERRPSSWKGALCTSMLVGPVFFFFFFSRGGVNVGKANGRGQMDSNGGPA